MSDLANPYDEVIQTSVIIKSEKLINAIKFSHFTFHFIILKITISHFNYIHIT